MKTNNAIYNKNSSKIKKTFNKKKKTYKCIFHCQINPNDCINSIDLIEDKVVFGTLMGDVLLCRVDENNLSGNYNENQIITNKEERRKSSISSPNNTDNMENDQSNIKLNHNNSNNKYDCIKLSIGKNNDSNSNYLINNDFEDEDNVKIFNKKNKNSQKPLIINLNNNNYNSRKNINSINNNNENRYFTNENNIDDEDEEENSNKYEKTLINKNMGKIQSSINGKDIKINESKIETKLFNEKKSQNKNCEIKDNNKIKFPQITKLILRCKENIPCLEFENNDIINISIGDLEVIHLENMSTFNINDVSSTYNYSKLRNYKTENEHIQFCENCTCMMSNSCYLIVFTKFGNFNSIIEIKDIKYEHKNLKEFQIIEGTIKMSNYVVPFDFDGDQFLFLDYISKDKRKITVVYTASKKEEYNYYINNKGFGHISHMKLLSNNKIFLCRNNKECEIHLMNNDFDVIEKWVHIGEDVISCCIYMNNKIEANKIKLNNNNGYEKYEEENNDNNNDKTQNDKKLNILKLIENQKKSNPQKKINKIINIETIHQRENTINIKRHKEQKLISSNSSDNNYNLTEMNQINFSKKNKFINNVHSLNPSFDNSSRRDINFTIENKRLSNNRNLKTNSGTKYNLITSDRKKINSKNSVSSIEIYENKNIQNRNNNKLNKTPNSSNGAIEDAQTVINIKDNDNYYIITLDKNGTVNMFNNKKQKTLFNLYNINNIDNKYKKLEFFSVGFPYYIVVNECYYCITTDHGLFVISKYNE